VRGKPGSEIDGVALNRIGPATGGAGVAREYPAVRYAGLQWQPTSSLDGLADCGQQPIGVIAGTARRTADEHDLSAIDIHVRVEEGNVVGGCGLLNISKHFIDGRRQHLFASLG
jgi:hypothetical protein